mmetsp:Transcript_33020/g.48408  ORF Transcript_33020/g.48408 Transcript_33020/m.48408 type:complete len:101 (-) Transcript_33020:282-584(-)
MNPEYFLCLSMRLLTNAHRIAVPIFLIPINICITLADVRITCKTDKVLNKYCHVHDCGFEMTMKNGRTNSDILMRDHNNTWTDQQVFIRECLGLLNTMYP